jgi:hypothetical protein
VIERKESNKICSNINLVAETPHKDVMVLA